MPDRRVLITAGASGIGRAMAQLFSDAGWKVWVTDVDPDALAPDTVRRAYLEGTSLRCFARPEDVAAMALFLASESGARISGQVVIIDGHTENPDPKV